MPRIIDVMDESLVGLGVFPKYMANRAPVQQV